MKKCLLFLLLIVSIFACRKDVVRDVSGNDNHSLVTDEFDYAADEAAFVADDTEGDEDGENSYNAEIASKMKITRVIGTDSLPILNPTTGKKQKYAKRQILNVNSVTRFTLYGYGFKAQSDTSKVIATIKTDSLGVCSIISWSDSIIVLDIPALEFPAHIAKYFSLKFRVYRSNDKLNKLAVTRVKSRACISRPQAEAAGAPSCSDASAIAYAATRRNEFSQTTQTTSYTNWDDAWSFNSTASVERTKTPHVGEILFDCCRSGDPETNLPKDRAAVIKTINGNNITAVLILKNACSNTTDPNYRWIITENVTGTFTNAGTNSIYSEVRLNYFSDVLKFNHHILTY